MIFKASLDKLAKGVSLGVCLLFTVLFVSQLILSNEGDIFIPLFMGCFFTIILFLAYAYHPLKYELTTDHLIIHRLISPVKMLRSDIVSVSTITKTQMGFVVRVFGVGGLFGYFGKFSSGAMGIMTWHATKRDNFIVVETNLKQKIVLTPNEPQLFLQQFNK